MTESPPVHWVEYPAEGDLAVIAESLREAAKRIWSNASEAVPGPTVLGPLYALMLNEANAMCSQHVAYNFSRAALWRDVAAGYLREVDP